MASLCPIPKELRGMRMMRLNFKIMANNDEKKPFAMAKLI